MPTVTTFPHGTPIWVDLQSTDASAAAEFYAALLGWDIAEPAPDSAGYRMASLGGVPVGAIGSLPANLADKGATPAWTTYLAVENADVAAAAIPDAGGTVLLPPGELGPGVRLLLAMDPSGAVVGLWEGTNLPGSWLRDEAGAVGWFELLGENATAAVAFYETVLGASVTHMVADDTDYPMLGVGEATFAGVAASDVPGLAAHWRVYFEVADLTASVARVRELGGSVLTDSATADGVGSWAAMTDPQGAVFSLIQPADAASDSQ
jgi:uncharacterized protein